MLIDIDAPPLSLITKKWKLFLDIIVDELPYKIMKTNENCIEISEKCTIYVMTI